METIITWYFTIIVLMVIITLGLLVRHWLNDEDDNDDYDNFDDDYINRQ